MSKIRKSFDEWYVKDYRKNRGNLYHEWLFLQMFPTEHLDFNEKTKNKILLLLHEAFLEGMNAGMITQVSYCQDLTNLVKLRGGKYKGQKIIDLPNTDDVFDEILRYKKATRDMIVRQACTAKLNIIKIARQERRERMLKLNRTKKL